VLGPETLASPKEFPAAPPVEARRGSGGPQFMIVHPADKSAVQWAVEHGYLFGYVREHGLPDPSLQISMGLSIAFFNAGRLVHWRARADGKQIDELMKELASLLGFCTVSRGYLPEELFLLHAARGGRRQTGNSN
jgi:hypothetical protein